MTWPDWKIQEIIDEIIGSSNIVCNIDFSKYIIYGYFRQTIA